MTDYRLYYFDSEGHIARSVELVRDTDEEAILTAGRYGSPHGTELWQLKRLVRAFPATKDPSPYIPPSADGGEPRPHPP